MRFQTVLAPAVAMLAWAGALSAATIYPVNDGFESPTLGQSGYGYGDSMPYGLNVPSLPSTPPGWSFTGTAGIAATGSTNFGVSLADNKNQNGGATNTYGQAGFLQDGYGDPNTISQPIGGFGAGTASVTFSLEVRGGNNASVDVKLDGVDLGTYTPASSSSFNTVTTPTTVVTAGSHTLTFTGVNNVGGGDNTDFIDDVSINNVVPEPATLALLSFGGFGLLARRRMA